MDSARAELLQALGQRIREIEAGSGAQLESSYSLGIPALEALLPGRQVPAGTLIELLASREGAGVWSLALFMAIRAAGQRSGIVVIDTQEAFYPPVAVKMGLAPERLIVVRPRTPRDVQAAWQEALRCSAVPAVIGWRPRLAVRECRQLQLAAEAGQSLGFLLRPGSARRETSFAMLRLLMTPMVSIGAARRLELSLLRCRGGREGQSLILEFDDETGLVHLPAEVAAAKAAARANRASG